MAQIIGNKVIELDCVDSTNNYLSKVVNETKVLNGTVILAHYQTNGKGQRGNTWESAKNKNLTFSIYLETSFLKLTQNFLLSMMVCNSVHQLLSHYVETAVIKWPNDLLIERKKTCGILIENSIKANYLTQSIIGIGLNLFQEVFEENSQATSLQLNTSKKLNQHKIFQELITILDANFLKLSQGNPLAIKNYYLNYLLGYKSELNYQWTSTNKQFVGEILEVEDSGLIKMRIDNQEIKWIEMKEIRLLTN